MSVLEANLERLLARAYAPARPRPFFAAQLEREVLAALARSDPRLRRRLAPALAVAAGLGAVALGSWALLRGRAPSLDEILASGAVAARTDRNGPWTSVEASNGQAQLAMDTALLEVATPGSAAAAIELSGAAAGARLRLGPESGVLLHAGPTVEGHGLDAVFHEGSLETDLPPSPASAHALARISTQAGIVELWGGAAAIADAVAPDPGSIARLDASDVPFLDVALNVTVGPAWDSPWTLLEVRSGLARCGSVEVAAGERVWLNGGHVFGERRRKEAELAGARAEVPSAEAPREEPAPAAPGRKILLRGRVHAEETALSSFRVVLLEKIDLPNVAEPVPFDVAREDGSFEIDAGVDPGTYSVFVQAEGFAVWRQDGVVLGGEEVPDLDAELERGGAVEGIVVHGDTLAPVEGAIVVSETDAPVQVLGLSEKEARRQEVVRFARTGPDGGFRLEHLRPGAHSLRASGGGLAAAWARAQVDTQANHAPVEIRLLPGGDVAGHVLGANFAPQSGILVLACTSDFAGDRACLSYEDTFTDEHGSYRIEGLAQGFWVVLKMGRPETFAEGLAPDLRFAQVVRGKTVVVDFAPKLRGAGLRGVVTDAAGTPLAGRMVMAVPAGPDGQFDDGRSVSTTIRDDGSYVLAELGPGAWELHVTGRRVPESVLAREVELRQGEDRVLDLRLPAGSIAGRVTVEETGAGLSAGLVILLTSGPSAHFVAKAFGDEHGRYEFPFVAAGSYRAIAYSARGEYGQESSGVLRVDDGLPTADVDLALRPGGNVVVRARDGQGRPVAGAKLWFEDERGDGVVFCQDSRTGAEGVQRVEGFKTGRWKVVVEGRSRAESWFTVRAGETTEVEVVESGGG